MDTQILHAGARAEYIPVCLRAEFVVFKRPVTTRPTWMSQMGSIPTNGCVLISETRGVRLE